MATAAGVAVATITVAQSLLGEIAATFGVGTGAAGVVVSATQLGYACGLVLVVPLGDIVQPRRLVAGQSFLSAGALAVAAAAPSFAVLLGAMAVVGALAVVIQVLVALAVALAPGGERGRAIGVVTGGVVAGLVAARTAAGLVNDALGLAGRVRHRRRADGHAQRRPVAAAPADRGRLVAELPAPRVGSARPVPSAPRAAAAGGPGAGDLRHLQRAVDPARASNWRAGPTGSHPPPSACSGWSGSPGHSAPAAPGGWPTAGTAGRPAGRPSPSCSPHGCPSPSPGGRCRPWWRA